MKKIMMVLLIALSLCCLTACKEEEEINTVGGWSEKDEELSDEVLEVFNKAVEGLTGVGYEPVKLIGTQVVAGTNYRILCNATTLSAEPTTTQKVLTIFEDLQGNVEILNISDYTE